MTLNELTYQGSKRRFMEVLKPLIENNLDEGMTYIEPFGGGMNSFTSIQTSSKIAGDNNEYNIALWQEIKDRGLDSVLTEWQQFINVLANCEDRPSGSNYKEAKELYLDMKKDCLSNGGSILNRFSDLLLILVVMAEAGGVVLLDIILNEDKITLRML